MQLDEAPGPPEEAIRYIEATVTPDFYQLINNQRLSYNIYTAGITEWRGKISKYKPVVHEFLRDGEQLAARMTGTIKLDGVDTDFESFVFGKVDKASKEMEWLIKRSIWGPIGGGSTDGA
ncbi:unnamed protein product [Clonostachys solani]|uniref:Uncharacterized protein n=1 Tax=Clonostachys solani TaxID=160281 RepID=A0A9N9Z1E6_9HYPO|nr:unnamed protein product [Clonostachys solani]